MNSLLLAEPAAGQDISAFLRANRGMIKSLARALCNTILPEDIELDNMAALAYLDASRTYREFSGNKLSTVFGFYFRKELRKGGFTRFDAEFANDIAVIREDGMPPEGAEYVVHAASFPRTSPSLKKVLAILSSGRRKYEKLRAFYGLDDAADLALLVRCELDQVRTMGRHLFIAICRTGQKVLICAESEDQAMHYAKEYGEIVRLDAAEREG
jgi:hypothetical protein